MAGIAKQVRWIIALGAAVLLFLLIRSSMQQTRFRYEVCVTFNGRNNCATADGATEADAIRSAQEIDCQLLANGRDQNMACLDGQPASIRKLSGR